MPRIIFLLKPFFAYVIFLVTLFNFVHFRAFRFDWNMYKKRRKKSTFYFLSTKGAEGEGGSELGRGVFLYALFLMLFWI